MGFRNCIERISYDACYEKIIQGIIVNSSNGHRLAVAMHPYFTYNKEFTSKIDNFIKDYEGPVLIFEEILIAGKTYNHVKKLGVKGNRHFVITSVSSPYPFGVEGDKWKDVLKRVNELRNEQLVDLAGGRFYSNSSKNNSWYGCLGVFASMLMENKVPINFLDDLVFE